MASVDDGGRTILRNMLLGRWAADKLGITGPEAVAYAEALASATCDPEQSDVFSRIRKDFDAAGVVQSNEQILSVMTDFMLKAGNHLRLTQASSADAATVLLARNLLLR